MRTVPITQGPLFAEVSEDRVVVWARGEAEGTLRVVVDGGGDRFRATRNLTADGDLIGKIRFDGLSPETEYTVRTWLVAHGQADEAGFRPPEGDDQLVVGTFQTPPAADVARAVTFAFGGDVTGQNVCRDKKRGLAVFEAVADVQPAFFLALGDMIYADHPCWFVGKFLNEQIRGPETPATSLDAYRKIWNHARADASYRKLMRQTGWFATWDDHEFLNDVSPGADVLDEYAPGVHLFPLGRQAFREQNPVIPAEGAAEGIYRSFRWGAHLEVFVLDTRSFRAPNAAKDDGATPKSMLGEAQRAWLVDGVRASTATWKVVATSVPLVIPTGEEEARDGWADGGGDTGFERELIAILEAFRDADVANLVFLTSDVHFATVHRIRPFPETHPGFLVHEIVVGPMSAGFFPRDDLDETLHPERRFMLAPENPEAIEGYLQALPWMNFGRIVINERGLLNAAVLSADGTVRYTFPIRPRLPEDGAHAPEEPPTAGSDPTAAPE